ncbi:hypothetical protein ID866_11604 [Astraeus odoratus]|nr:hypothetical protein ID866_11604 [Astraeus odoratus]
MLVKQPCFRGFVILQIYLKSSMGTEARYQMSILLHRRPTHDDYWSRGLRMTS